MGLNCSVDTGMLVRNSEEVKIVVEAGLVAEPGLDQAVAQRNFWFTPRVGLKHITTQRSEFAQVVAEPVLRHSP